MSIHEKASPKMPVDMTISTLDLEDTTFDQNWQQYGAAARAMMRQATAVDNITAPRVLLPFPLKLAWLRLG